LPTFQKFGNAKKSDICVIFTKKIMGSHETGGASAPPPGPGLKSPLITSDKFHKHSAVSLLDTCRD